ncbi:MAG TPA: alpha-amylase family glycosyl hydrolase, partial [Actinomycetota bacterium]|nr:alpha-amylase family glycosyl hydrolase [Actinomycetota bacterium]
MNATYRIQLNKDFTFSDARKLVPYLARLGISHLYASPIWRARAGSMHGYDVVDPTSFNPELGTAADFHALADAVRAHGMELMVDVVPNHVATGAENPWWTDVLLNGPSSYWASAFDIDWDAGNGKVVLPVLGAPYADVLEKGELRLEMDGGALWAEYYDERFPVRPARGVSVERANGDPAVLHDILEDQHYRLAWWRTSAHAINYRRFFDITHLAGVRVEDPDVFDASHGLVHVLTEERAVAALRIDHIDGLYDPRRYLERLATFGADIFVEKILEANEALPAGWPVHGTTGYDFATTVGDLFVDADGLEKLRAFTATYTGDVRSFAEIVNDGKRLVLHTLFRPELTRLAQRLHAIAAGDVRARDLDPAAITETIAEMSVALPVY